MLALRLRVDAVMAALVKSDFGEEKKYQMTRIKPVKKPFHPRWFDVFESYN